MRRTFSRLTAPVSAGAVCLILVLGRIDWRPTPGMGIPLCTGVSALVFLAFGSVFCRTPTNLLPVAFLFLGGAAMMLTSQLWLDFNNSLIATGLDVDSVESVQITLRGDPRITRNAGWAAQGYLNESRNSDLSLNAFGPITVFGRGSADGLAAGRKVDLRGFMALQPDSGGVPRFYSDSSTCGDWASDYHRIRYSILHRLSGKLDLLDPVTKSFVSILLLGQKTEVSSALARIFGNAGVLHILALSGFHLGLIAAAVRLLLKGCCGKRCATLVSALCALLFCRPKITDRLLLIALR